MGGEKVAWRCVGIYHWPGKHNQARRSPDDDFDFVYVAIDYETTTFRYY
ncbi:hypothetical protein COLO4_10063 [Corchorus olitorius]|uniref:Uncharacterized protein n=1 Tax=Corchorus olitorius TaxID=93759 RepID=A0A1R3KA60_9ROSI|nr:hypothetical protein COLO4_10063 [Corchorus olitorius]